MSRKSCLLRRKLMQVTQVIDKIKPGTKEWLAHIQSLPRLEAAEVAVQRIVRHDEWAPKPAKLMRRLNSLYIPKGAK